MKPLSSQLLQWTPRGPSPRLARNLFHRGAIRAAHPQSDAMRWAWLAPAAALFLLMTSLKINMTALDARQHAGSRSSSAKSGLMASLYERPAEGWNVVSKTIEWTNADNARSNKGFFLYTTNVIQD